MNDRASPRGREPRLIRAIGRGASTCGRRFTLRRTLRLWKRLRTIETSSVPVPHGYSQYWYFRPDDRGVVDITLGVPVSASEGPQILGYVALPRLLVRERGIRVFGSSESRLVMYGHSGLEFIFQLARA